MIEVRLVDKPKDFQAVRQLRLTVFVEEQEWQEEDEFDEFDSEAFHALAFVDDEPVGTGRLYFDDDDEAFIGRMAVDQSARGKGIGAQILSLLESTAKEQGAKRISLNAQTYVQPFYERAGYVAEGETFMDEHVEHILMRRDI